MSMSALKAPLIVMVAVFMGMVFLVLILIALAGTGGPVTAGISTGLISASNEGTSLLPWVAIIFCGGIVFVALGGRN